MTARHVVLVGLMGSGKSSVGRHLAETLGRPFVDTDLEVEKAEGRTITDIFRTSGEEAFRDAEEAILDRVLGEDRESVVATGGGVVLREANRSRLHNHCVVWLRAETDTLVERVERSRHERPLLGDDPRSRLESLAAERARLYLDVSDVAVDVDGRSVPVVVDLIAEAIRPITRLGA